MKNKNKIWIWLTIVILIILGAIGAKRYMDMKAQEKDYQDGIAIIQNYVSDYLVKNYQGIEKIEWQGIGVEYRNSPTHGASLFGNYVNTRVRVYVSNDLFFTMRFTLTEETDYDDDLKKYVKLDSLNQRNTDVSIEVGLQNASNKLTSKKKVVFDKLKKSKEGSPKTKVSYNLDIHELKY